MKKLIEKIKAKMTALRNGECAFLSISLDFGGLRFRYSKPDAPLNFGEIKIKYRNFKEFLYCEFLTVLGNRRREVFMVAYMFPDNSVALDEICCSMGDEYSALLPPPKFVAERCKSFGAQRIIMIHNHPDAFEIDDLCPSVSDITSTEEYVKQLKKVGISVFDHLITGSIGVYSLRDNNQL